MLYSLIPLLPLAAFLVLGLAGRQIKDRAHLVAVPAVLLSFLLSLAAFAEVVSGSVISVPLYTWLTSGHLDAHIGLYIDRLTAVMLLLVTGVSSLVHIYTIGYMHHEPGYARFFGYIALFTFSMLMLVLADNLLQLFVFWEAVGLCSYLLIGHWYERASACAAATKAFLVNRVGDFGFILGVLLVWYNGLITPNSVGTSWLINILIIAVLGGMRHPVGPFLGAAVVLGLRNWVSSFFEMHHAIMGAVFIATVLWAPLGLVGIAGRIRARLRKARHG